MFSMIGKKGGKTVGIGRGGKNLIEKKKKERLNYNSGGYVGKDIKPFIREDDIESDYEYQRQNFYNLVERGNDAIEGILELAKESEHPRTYEVAGNLIKQVSEVTGKLGDLQEKMRKLKEVPNNAPNNVTNALFVGSTAELQKMLKDS